MAAVGPGALSTDRAGPSGPPVRRLLALRALGLGDLLTAVPALRALADAHPAHRLELAAPAALDPLVELVGGGWNVVDVAPLAPLPEWAAAPDVAVNLHGRGPQSHRLLLETRPRELLAFAHPEVPASRAGPQWRDDEHEVGRWCRMLSESGVAADSSRLALDAPPDDAPVLARGATLVHPGAASPARRWPLDRFAAVARAERAAGRAVVVTGSSRERALAAELCALAGLPPEADLAGATGLGELAATVAAAGRVVCGDTGVAHLATALGVPSVVLFGPSAPTEWGPPPDRPRHRVLWSGRCGDPHGEEPDPGLLEITVDDVIAALAEAQPAALGV